MKAIKERTGSDLCLCACLLFALLPLNAQAHDPGLSSANVTIGDQQIEVLLGFARKDVETMLTVGSPQRGSETLKDFAARELAALAQNEFSFYQGEQRVTAAAVNARQNDSRNIEISLRFPRPESGKVRFVSNLIAELPLGHREFLSIKSSDGASVAETMLSVNENSFQFDLPEIRTARPASLKDHSFFAFLKLGIEHILTGYDHLLFLFALMIVCRDLRSILTVITCFTVAHSITLALAALDVVRLPGRFVEPMIAASIAYVGVENLFRGEAPRWRGLITFSFGLIHGLGFADALREFGIHSGRYGIVLPLVGFNLGVEVGQLLVAAMVLPVLWQLRKSPSFPCQWVPACSVLVVCLGSYWMIERIIQN